LETLLAAGTFTVSWFVEKFGGIKPDELGLDLSAEQILEAAAAQVEPGANGLLAVPYWNNAMMPYWDLSARGVMLGWTGLHGKAHAYRAIIEGIAFEQRLMTDGAEKGLEKPIEKLLAMGGGSQSPLWCQIVADIMQRPISVCQELESTCLGAGMLAAAAIGIHDEKRVEFYDRMYTNVYKEIYPQLAPLFSALAETLETKEV
jgi:xylulokinase